MAKKQLATDTNGSKRLNNGNGGGGSGWDYGNAYARPVSQGASEPGSQWAREPDSQVAREPGSQGASEPGRNSGRWDPWRGLRGVEGWVFGGVRGVCLWWLLCLQGWGGKWRGGGWRASHRGGWGGVMGVCRSETYIDQSRYFGRVRQLPNFSPVQRVNVTFFFPPRLMILCLTSRASGPDDFYKCL